MLMLTWENDIDVHALHRQGWTLSPIARHLAGTVERSVLLSVTLEM